MAVAAVRGVHDILPEASRRWQEVEAAARRVFEAYGYGEVRLPIFERTELFARGIGEVTDIVQKEMYTFEDRSGESLTLRPEATASVLRAYIEHGLHVRPKPVRLYTLGPMFRYERPQAGRYRQFHQLNVEALGERHPALDAEQMAMLLDFFRAVGLGDRVALEINSLGDAACRPRYREGLVDYLGAHAAGLCDECHERTARNPLRALDCKKPGCRPVLEAAPALGEFLCDECRGHFDSVQSALAALGVPYRVRPGLVRGFDYYVRTTFELVTAALGAQSAVAGGGRYDGLLELLGGPSEPGIGFAIGLERVLLLLGDAGREPPPLAVLIPLGREALAALLPVARAVRAAGRAVELAYGERKLRAELERSNRLGAAWAVIVGSAELERGEATLRRMATGEQRSVPLARLADELGLLEPQARRPRGRDA